MLCYDFSKLVYRQLRPVSRARVLVTSLPPGAAHISRLWWVCLFFSDGTQDPDLQVSIIWGKFLPLPHLRYAFHLGERRRVCSLRSHSRWVSGQRVRSLEGGGRHLKGGLFPGGHICIGHGFVPNWSVRPAPHPPAAPLRGNHPAPH